MAQKAPEVEGNPSLLLSVNVTHYYPQSPIPPSHPPAAVTGTATDLTLGVKTSQLVYQTVRPPKHVFLPWNICTYFIFFFQKHQQKSDLSWHDSDRLKLYMRSSFHSNCHTMRHRTWITSGLSLWWLSVSLALSVRLVLMKQHLLRWYNSGHLISYWIHHLLRKWLQNQFWVNQILDMLNNSLCHNWQTQITCWFSQNRNRSAAQILRCSETHPHTWAFFRNRQHRVQS